MKIGQDIKNSPAANLQLDLVKDDKPETVKFSKLLDKPTVLVFQPGMSNPQDVPKAWSGTVGAQGCTGQALRYNSLYPKFQELGVNVYIVTSKPHDQQIIVAKEKQISIGIICDPNLLLKEKLDLQSFSVEGIDYFKRQTILVIDGKVKQLFSPQTIDEAKLDADNVHQFLLKTPEIVLPATQKFLPEGVKVSFQNNTVTYSSDDSSKLEELLSHQYQLLKDNQPKKADEVKIKKEPDYAKQLKINLFNLDAANKFKDQSGQPKPKPFSRLEPI